MYHHDVSRAVADFLEVMKNNGELDELIAHVAEIQSPYYSGIVTEKKTAFNTDYYVTVVPRCDADGNKISWKLGIANDAYDGIGKESTINFAARKNATLAVNCGVYDTNTGAPMGVLIKDGRIVQTGTPAEDKYQYLAIMANGAFRVYPRSTTAGQMLNDGAIDAVCIFGSLITDGVYNQQTDDRDEPRQSIGIRSDGSTVIITVDGRKPGEDAGMSYAELAQIHAENGSVNAWILDGGGSASTVLRGVKQNDSVDYFYQDRAVNNFLYIEKENAADPSTNPGNDLGATKQQLVQMIVKNIDIQNGYIRLRGPEGYLTTGIEMYVDGEETRRCKMGLNIDKSNKDNTYFYVSFRAGDTASSIFRIYERGVYVQTYHGTSSERPNAGIGFMYFDTTLNKPIWKGASGWVDASGASV